MLPRLTQTQLEQPPGDDLREDYTAYLMRKHLK